MRKFKVFDRERNQIINVITDETIFEEGLKFLKELEGGKIKDEN